ncbi:MAG: threonine/serine dehydratase [Antricoccus sp.]
MTLVELSAIEAAAQRINPHVVHTPLLPVRVDASSQLWVKPESLQQIGAFKIRGALNAVSQVAGLVDEVVTHSSGNHGQALAAAAAIYGLHAIVVIPDDAPQIKINAVRARGAEVILVPGTERLATAERIVAERGAALIPPYDHDDVIAGQGTVGLEVGRDFDGPGTVLVPVGGGGLISGVAAALAATRPDLTVIGVEPELAGDASESFAAASLTRWPRSRTARTIADGLRSDLSDRTFAHISAYVSDVVTVSESLIIEAARLLCSTTRLIVEPSGAVATAGYLAHRAAIGDRAVAIISGGNVDPSWFAALVLNPVLPASMDNEKRA